MLEILGAVGAWTAQTLESASRTGLLIGLCFRLAPCLPPTYLTQTCQECPAPGPSVLLGELLLCLSPTRHGRGWGQQGCVDRKQHANRLLGC